MGSSVSDEALARLSSKSYGDAAVAKIKVGNHEETWKRIDMDRELLGGTLSKKENCTFRHNLDIF
ncbi:hypothetical protein [Bacillus pseudomycoides]|uniref:hypothetical protein n=1 Tax=Bacillus pseudomycoides TaxID=64104 RepID=UPI001FB4057E|nr:hypothetical protein [Bacillus pseudomycoides]